MCGSWQVTRIMQTELVKVFLCRPRAIGNEVGLFHTFDNTYTFSQSEEMYDAVAHQIAHRVVRQDISAHVHHADVRGQSGNIRLMSEPCRN